jgi:hypothetical protein
MACAWRKQQLMRRYGNLYRRARNSEIPTAAPVSGQWNKNRQDIFRQQDKFLLANSCGRHLTIPTRFSSGFRWQPGIPFCTVQARSAGRANQNEKHRRELWLAAAWNLGGGHRTPEE